MNWAHIHLILNQIPLIGVGFTILLFIAAEVKKGDEVLKLRDENGMPYWAGWRKK